MQELWSKITLRAVYFRRGILNGKKHVSKIEGLRHTSGSLIMLLYSRISWSWQYLLDLPDDWRRAQFIS